MWRKTTALHTNKTALSTGSLSGGGGWEGERQAAGERGETEGKREHHGLRCEPRLCRQGVPRGVGLNKLLILRGSWAWAPLAPASLSPDVRCGGQHNALQARRSPPSLRPPPLHPASQMMREPAGDRGWTDTRTLTSMASLSNMRSCRKSSSLILRSWKSSSIWAWASSSCCSTVSMWLMELLCGVLLLEMAESLRRGRRGRDGHEKVSHCQTPDPAGCRDFRGKKAGRKRGRWSQKTESAAPPAAQRWASSPEQAARFEATLKTLLSKEVYQGKQLQQSST